MLPIIRINNSSEIFISYHFDVETNVLELCELISTEFTEKIAISKICEEEYGSNIPFDKIANLIDVSKRIICCITKSYFKTTACVNELNYSIKSKKPIIFMLFENISMKKYFENNNIKFKNPIECNLYLDYTVFDSRVGEIYDELMLNIHTLMNSEMFLTQKKFPRALVKPASYNNLSTFQVFSKNQAKYYYLPRNQRDLSCFGCKKMLTVNRKEQFVYFDESKLNSKIISNCIIFMKKHFHRNCFSNLKCPYCKDIFKDDEIYKDKKLTFICQKCIYPTFGENGMTNEVKKDETICFKCKKEVLNKHFVNISGKNYHSECLKCTNCKEPLSKENGDLTNENFSKGMFCKTCSLNINKSKSCIIL
jgi:hypothetical protein